MKNITLCLALLFFTFLSRAQKPTLSETVTHILHFIQGEEKLGDPAQITNGDTTIRLFGKFLSEKIGGAQGTMRMNGRSVMVIINNTQLSDAQANENTIIAAAQENLPGLTISSQGADAVPGAISNKTYILMIGKIMTLVNLQIISKPDATPEKKYKQMIMFDRSDS